MLLSKKFVLLLTSSVTSIAILNIFAFYLVYNINITKYLSEKIDSREEVTLEYINEIVEQQTVDELNQIFSESELEFFELLDLSGGSIPLDSEKNINIVIDYLVRSGISAEYIQQIIPENNIEKVLDSLKNPESPESHFIQRLIRGLVISNIIFLAIIALIIIYISNRTIRPIQKTTQTIRKFKIGTEFQKIEYDKEDEIGLLIDSINTLNRKLSLQDKIRTQLVADISHELKTPISSIQCYLEGISDGVINLDKNTLDLVSSEMNRLIKLVNMILDFQQLESQETAPEKTHFNLYMCIKEIQEKYHLSLIQQGQSIEILGSKNVEIYAQKDLFIQLLYNIIGNFQKYAGNNAILTVDIHAKHIHFRDNGVGIKKNEVPFLFEKFYQGKKEKSGRAEKRGIGVGLAVVKKICELHNWNPEIHADLGEGFCITIYTHG